MDSFLMKFGMVFLMEVSSLLFAADSPSSFPAKILMNDGSLIEDHIKLKAGSYELKTRGQVQVRDLLEVQPMTTQTKAFSGQHESILLKNGSRWTGQWTGWDPSGKITWKTPEGRELILNFEDVLNIDLNETQHLPKTLSSKGLSIVMTHGKVLQGSISYVTPKLIGFKGKYGRVRLEREKIAKVIWSMEPVLQGQKLSILQTRSGHVIYGQVYKLSDQGIEMKVDKELISFPLHSIYRIELYSPKVKALTHDLPNIKGTPFMESLEPPSFQRSIFGGDLRLDGISLARGISMHSQTKLTYPLSKAFDSLVFQVGMDPKAPHHGPCVLRLQTDSGVNQEWTLGKGYKPTWEQVDLKGAKELTYTLEYGDDGSFGDYVVIGNPRLIGGK
jgi:hypothetical protein